MCPINLWDCQFLSYASKAMMGTYHLKCPSRSIRAVILVGMSLQGHLPITLLDIFWGGITRDTEGLVMIDEILILHDDFRETVILSRIYVVRS